jgi:hypothetical protein
VRKLRCSANWTACYVFSKRKALRQIKKSK